MQPKGKRNLRRQNTEPVSEEPDHDPDNKEEANNEDLVNDEEVNDQPEVNGEEVNDQPEVNGVDEIKEEPFEEVTVAEIEEVPPELENEDGASIGKRDKFSLFLKRKTQSNYVGTYLLTSPFPCSHSK